MGALYSCSVGIVNLSKALKWLLPYQFPQPICGSSMKSATPVHGRRCCSSFGAVSMEDQSTYSESTISHHRSHIVDDRRSWWLMDSAMERYLGKEGKPDYWDITFCCARAKNLCTASGSLYNLPLLSQYLAFSSSTWRLWILLPKWLLFRIGMRQAFSVLWACKRLRVKIKHHQTPMLFVLYCASLISINSGFYLSDNRESSISTVLTLSSIGSVLSQP